MQILSNLVLRQHIRPGSQQTPQSPNAPYVQKTLAFSLEGIQQSDEQSCVTSTAHT